MTGRSNSQSLNLQPEYARWIAKIDPNTVVTLTLNQAVCFEGPKGPVWQRGDRIVYESVFKGFIHRLIRDLFGRRKARNGRDTMPCVGVVEGNGVDQHFHIHFVARRPSDIAIDDFRGRLLQLISSSRWFKPDIDVQDHAGGFVAYMLKKGPDALIFP